MPFIRGEETLPYGARRTGEFSATGKEVYAEDEEIREEVQLYGPDKKPRWYTNPDGTRKKPMTEFQVVEVRERKFILEQIGNGMVQKNYDFQPDPMEAERARIAAENSPEKVRERMQRQEAILLALAEKLGMDPKELTEMAGAEK